MKKEEINIRDYIDPLGRWPRLFWDDQGILWIEYVITEGTLEHHRDVFKFVKAPYDLLDKIYKNEK